MHPDLLNNIPVKYRDAVHRLTIALMRAYTSTEAERRAGEFMAEVQRQLDERGE